MWRLQLPYYQPLKSIYDINGVKYDSFKRQIEIWCHNAVSEILFSFVAALLQKQWCSQLLVPLHMTGKGHMIHR